jgi:hypothetical protein
MTEQELAAFATWLRHTQGVEIEPTALREPASAAAALGALVGAAAKSLPFGAEPSGFDAAIAKLSVAAGGPGGNGPGGNGERGNGDVG